MLLLLLCFVPFSFFVCSLSLQARPPVAVVVGHSLVQLKPQEGDRTDTWLGGLFVPSTKNDLYSVHVPNTSQSLMSHPLSRVVKRRSIDRLRAMLCSANELSCQLWLTAHIINADNIFSNEKTLWGSYWISALCFLSFHLLASEVIARWFEQHIY